VKVGIVQLVAFKLLTALIIRFRILWYVTPCCFLIGTNVS
jgi:hypothetical protein